MKKIKLIYLLIAFIFGCINSNLQARNTPPDTIGAIVNYGVQFEKNIYHITNSGQKILGGNINPNSKPNAATADSNFQFYFADIFNNNTYGFNDAANGASYVQCVVAAFEYIESVIAVPILAKPIKIYINPCDNTSFPPAISQHALAYAGIFYDSLWANAAYNAPVSFSGGFLHDHIVNGAAPTSSNYKFDGLLAFNLRNFSFATNCGAPAQNCNFDLFSIALHEATHLLGFCSTIEKDTAAASNL